MKFFRALLKHFGLIDRDPMTDVTHPAHLNALKTLDLSDAYQQARIDVRAAAYSASDACVWDQMREQVNARWE